MNMNLIIIITLIASAMTGVVNIIFSGNINLDSLEQEVFQAVNIYRTSRDLPALQWSEIIAEQCRGHSTDMAANFEKISHSGFEHRVEQIKQNINIISGSENVAYNFGVTDPGSVAVNGWINSPGHRANMEGDYQLTGIGIAQDTGGGLYFTQIFISPAGVIDLIEHDSLSRLVFNRIKELRHTEGLNPLKYDFNLEEFCIWGCETLMEMIDVNSSVYEDIIVEITKIYGFSGIGFNYLKFTAVDNPDSVIISSWLENSENNNNLCGNFNLTGMAALHDSLGDYIVLEIFLRQDTLCSH